MSYRPATTTYVLERHDSLTLQYPGGATQQQIRDRTAFLRVSLAQSAAAGALQVSIVLDSLVALENGMPLPPDSLAAARGTRWTGTITGNGALSRLQASRSSGLGDELAGRLRALLPPLPAGGARQGMAWADSTEFPILADAFAGAERALTTYQVADGEVEGAGGRKALKIESTGSYTRTGHRVQGEQELEMTANGTRAGIHLLGLDGVLLSARGSDAGDMTISVPALGQTVPVKQSGSFTIAPVGR